MARRPGMAGPGPFADLAKKSEILEQELAVQRAALERLKALGSAPRRRLPAEKAHRPNVAFDRP
jgi:hypothetical protein